MSQFRSLLVNATAHFVSLSDEQLSQLEIHYSLLVKWNRRLNLTAIRTVEEAVNHHYAESLFLASHLLEDTTVVDVGSGAGFPGVPIAVARPLSTVSLIESHQRKAVFLTESSRHLKNTHVQASRFEELNWSWGTLVSRAVAWREISNRALVGADHLALLVGTEDLQGVQQTPGFVWAKPIPLPDPNRGYLLQADVPRETLLS